MKRKWKWATPLCAGGTGSKHYSFTPQVELFTSTFAHTGTTIINRHTKETIHPVFAKYQKKAYNVMILVWTKQNNCEQDLLLIHQSYRYLQLQKKNSFPPKTSIFLKIRNNSFANLKPTTIDKNTNCNWIKHDVWRECRLPITALAGHLIHPMSCLTFQNEN